MIPETYRPITGTNDPRYELERQHSRPAAGQKPPSAGFCGRGALTPRGNGFDARNPRRKHTFSGGLFSALLLILLTPVLRAAAPVDILVQGAEKLEVREILAALEDSKKVEIGRFSFWTGRIGPHTVAVSLTGQGLLNCTISTVLGIEEFSPKLIVNQGTSGAQVPYLALHDIIIGRRALDYGNFITPVRAPAAGSDALTWTPLPQRLRDPVTGALVEFPLGFAGDPESLAVAMRTRNPMGRVYPGIIGSAHEVNLELDRVRWSAKTFGMDVEEMESGHVAALAHAYGIRCIAFRVVSDAPYEGVPFFAQAARATAVFTVNFLHNLPALP
jgi:adenosylhomocysteine nucleosidase